MNSLEFMYSYGDTFKHVSVYRCPCGQGEVVEVISSESYNVYLECSSCKKKYLIEIDGLSFSIVPIV